MENEDVLSTLTGFILRDREAIVSKDVLGPTIASITPQNKKARRIISRGPSDFSSDEAYFAIASWKFVATFSMKPSVVSQG